MNSNELLDIAKKQEHVNSDNKLAKQWGINRSNISAIRNGTKSIPIKRVRQIAANDEKLSVIETIIAIKQEAAIRNIEKIRAKGSANIMMMICTILGSSTMMFLTSHNGYYVNL